MEYCQLKYMLSGTQKEDRRHLHAREGMQLPSGTLSTATIYNSNTILNSNLINAFMMLGETGIITSTPSLTIVLSRRGEKEWRVLNLIHITILLYARPAVERLRPQEFFCTQYFPIP